MTLQMQSLLRLLHPVACLCTLLCMFKCMELKYVHGLAEVALSMKDGELQVPC